MSLLWNTAIQHEAMPWNHENQDHFKTKTAHPVKKAGFASYVNDEDDVRQAHEDHLERRDEENGGQEPFNEDLYEESSPEPTPEEDAHNDEHGEYPESFYNRHDEAYDKALKDDRKLKDEDLPDHHDPDLMRFVGGRGTDTDFWLKHGEHKPISLQQPIHATQGHVSEEHIERYAKNPRDKTDHQYRTQGWAGSRYLGNEGPMFVTHQGRLHTIEGHHRVAAGLRRGDDHVMGWHYDLDKDPGNVRGDQYDEDDDDY